MMRRADLLAILIALASLSCGDSREAGPVEGIVRSADGVPIHYRVEGTGSPALVFVHGWSCDGTYWEDQMTQFATSHRVVAIDLGGHGRSGTGREAWTMEAYGADVVAVLAELRIENAVLVGHSMGGPVIVEAALAAPNRVRGLVGVDNFQFLKWNVTKEQIDGWLTGYRADFAGTTEGWVRSMFAEDADAALVDRVAKDMAASPPEVGIGALENTLLWWLERGEERIRKLSVPLRCINSDKNPTDTTALAAAVPGYHLDLMPGRGHFVMLEDPATFNALLENSVAVFAGTP